MYHAVANALRLKGHVGNACTMLWLMLYTSKVAELDDIEKTSKALEAAGVPMKTEIEGEVGAPLRQTATQAVMSTVVVADAGKATTVEWPYAYFELAQRDPYRRVFARVSPVLDLLVRGHGFISGSRKILRI